MYGRSSPIHFTKISKQRIAALCLVLLLLGVAVHRLWLHRQPWWSSTYYMTRCDDLGTNLPMETVFHGYPLNADEVLAKRFGFRPELDQSVWEETFYRYLQQETAECKRYTRIGPIQDGGWQICEDELYKPKPPCLVYSFGVGTIWEFDDLMPQVYGCEVHAFDPTIGSSDYRRSKNVYFHASGLYNKNATVCGIRMRTLAGHKQDLHHTGKPISVLKIDVEMSELQALPQAIREGALAGVTQLMMELHVPTYMRSKQEIIDGKVYRNIMDLIFSLENLGFRYYYHLLNQHLQIVSPVSGRTRFAFMDLYFVNPRAASGQDML